jgi:hypothetical protein
MHRHQRLFQIDIALIQHKRHQGHETSNDCGDDVRARPCVDVTAPVQTHHEHQQAAGVQCSTDVVEILDVSQHTCVLTVFHPECRWMVEEKPTQEATQLDAYQNIITPPPPHFWIILHETR